MIAGSVRQTMQYDAEFMLKHLKTVWVFDGQNSDNADFCENDNFRQILLIIDNENTILEDAPLSGFEERLNSLESVNCKS
uniref:Uncharacterized protein n=2 Tax=Methylophaga nitratireducenticrescens TaxID=754476 RepID=I1XL83_METNJ